MSRIIYPQIIVLKNDNYYTVSFIVRNLSPLVVKNLTLKGNLPPNDGFSIIGYDPDIIIYPDNKNFTLKQNFYLPPFLSITKTIKFTITNNNPLYFFMECTQTKYYKKYIATCKYNPDQSNQETSFQPIISSNIVLNDGSFKLVLINSIINSQDANITNLKITQNDTEITSSNEDNLIFKSDKETWIQDIEEIKLNPNMNKKFSFNWKYNHTISDPIIFNVEFDCFDLHWIFQKSTKKIEVYDGIEYDSFYDNSKKTVNYYIKNNTKYDCVNLRYLFNHDKGLILNNIKSGPLLYQVSTVTLNTLSCVSLKSNCEIKGSFTLFNTISSKPGFRIFLN